MTEIERTTVREDVDPVVTRGTVVHRASPPSGLTFVQRAIALIFGVIHTMAYDLSPNTWQMSLGIALLVLIIFLPEGLWSLFGKRAA